jgi:uncharacterized membrane protein
MSDNNFNINDVLNTEDTTNEFDTQDVQDNKIWAALSYVGILFFLPLVVNNGKSKYGRFHANQGFTLFLTDIVVTIAAKLLDFIPVVGSILSWLLSLAILALCIIGIVNAATGKAKKLPVIGNLIHVFDK